MKTSPSGRGVEGADPKLGKSLGGANADFAPAAYRRERTRSGKVTLATKAFQAVGALPEAIKNFAFNTFLLFYYNQVLGLNALAASAAIAGALIIDAACDPLIGSFSDGLRSRLGRRHPLMYLSAAPIGIGLFMVFSPPSGLGGEALLAWLFVSVVFTHLAMSLFVVPWTALYAEFSDDYVERTTIVTWRYGVGLAGMFVFTLSTWRVIFASTRAYTPGQLNPHAYGVFAVAAAVTVSAAVLITTHLTRREIPFLLQPVARPPRFGLARVWRDIASTFHNRDFLVLFFGALTYAGISGTIDALGTYVVTYFWGLAPEQLQWFALDILGAVFAFAALGVLGRLFDKKTVLLVSFGLLMLDGMGVIGLRLAHILPPNGSPLLLAILVGNEMLRNFLNVLLGIVFVSMLADTIDVQELVSGRRQEGIFSAALSFSGKATAGVGAVIAGFLLQAVVRWPIHVDPHAADPHTVTRLGVVAGLLVPLLLVIPLMLGGLYRITRASHAEVRAELALRRAV
ncbi:MAG TPA: MFS transporter [Caulobacteraceae bacterium]